MRNDVSALFEPGSFINGQWLTGDDRFKVVNKATGDTLAEVANAGAAEMELAVKAAKEAFSTWSATPAITRGQLLRKWFTLMTERSDELAELLTLEQGKPLAEAKGEIAYGAGYIEWFAEEARRIVCCGKPTVFHHRFEHIQQLNVVLGNNPASYFHKFYKIKL